MSSIFLIHPLIEDSIAIRMHRSPRYMEETGLISMRDIYEKIVSEIHFLSNHQLFIRTFICLSRTRIYHCLLSQ